MSKSPCRIGLSLKNLFMKKLHCSESQLFNFYKNGLYINSANPLITQSLYTPWDIQGRWNIFKLGWDHLNICIKTFLGLNRFEILLKSSLINTNSYCIWCLWCLWVVNIESIVSSFQPNVSFSYSSNIFFWLECSAI